MSAHPTRRTVLRLGGAAVAAGLGAAGCDRVAAGASAPASSGGSSSGASAAWARLSRALGSRLLRPGDGAWTPAALSALSADPRFATAAPPQAVARAASAADVAACVAFAGEAGIDLAVRAGGHSYAGASRGQGLVLDLSALDSVSVGGAGGAGGAGGRTLVTVGAGAQLVSVYSALGAAGLAIGAGSCPTVGVSGLTLGGGVGVLTPSFGLTCDQVVGVRAVTATGRLVTAGAEAEPDLFWALRGGGAGTATVVEWTFAARPAPTVTVFSLRWPWSAAAAVTSAWQQWAARGPRELWSGLRLLTRPGQGGRVVVTGTLTGPSTSTAGSAELDAALAGLLDDLPAPEQRSSSRLDYAAAMLYEAGCSDATSNACAARAADPARRAPFAATSSMLARPLPQAGVAAAVAAVEAGGDVAGLVEGGMAFDVLGGAVADVAADATPFPWRGALATVQHTATWAPSRAAADPAPYDALVHAQRAALRPWCGGAGYANYADAELLAQPEALWGDNAPRLAGLKA